ncbi:MAG: stage III sporulation protein AE [Oscillibacter sp.]|jgi:stage III sporulation protein AE|nr:stage III sporulation protein AE [Oscillibacter sp.]
MKRLICCCILATFLILPAKAVKVPRELLDAMPRQAETFMDRTGALNVSSLYKGVEKIWDGIRGQMDEILRSRLRDAVGILLVVLLCGVAEGFCRGTEAGISARLTSVAGALAISLLTAGSMDTLIGLGADTLGALSDFSKVLLPTLAAAAASAGAVGTATVQQVTAVFFVDLLLRLINGLLLPLVYLYIGTLTAAAMLPESRLSWIAEGLKKTVTWILSAVLVAFTLYLSAVRIISGSADTAAVKVAKAAIAGAVPVVGSILSEASETVLAGAGLLKSTIGIFGMLAVLAVSIYPFLQLGIQYLLYKLTAFLAGTVGTPELCRLIDGLGGAFGLVLGMVGAGALLILISVLSCVAAVTV